MASDPRPHPNASADAHLVRRLLREQHPDLAEAPLSEVEGGWDNHVFRLGDSLAVRLPRRVETAPLVLNEHRWLPLLGAQLPLPTPVPLRTGAPGCGFPWHWSIVPWLDGESFANPSAVDAAAAAAQLRDLLCALHRHAPADAPSSPWRGVPLDARTDGVLDRIARLGDEIDGPRVRALWSELVRTPPWQGRRVWIHGDLHPGNLLVKSRRLSAVLDFGDLCAGDPATDLSVGWMMLPAQHRTTLRTRTDDASVRIDDDTWQRARGWALALSLVYLADAARDPRLTAIGRVTLNAVLNDMPVQAG